MTTFPTAIGLYDPANEKDSCGVGFIAHIKGQASHQIVQNAWQMLCNMDHRGATGSEHNTGDGAGILTALPHKLLRREAEENLGRILPQAGQYAVGLVFFPQDAAAREMCRRAFNAVIARQGQKLLGWRIVPTDAISADLGPSAHETEPHIEMLFVAAADGLDQSAFERQLVLIRKQGIRTARERLPQGKVRSFYVCSLSSRVIVYKGQLTPKQLFEYYLDLQDEDYESHLAMIHSRFSTNTFPSWERAQPFRYMAHNGEINTLRGNENWMYARQGVLHSERFGQEIFKLYPIIDPNTSDSGKFDNALELLVTSGRKLPEAVMMMVPEAWENHESMDADKKAFYEYNSTLLEPWDGPASVSFTDGRFIGAVLDRNGLRPSRYYVTSDDLVIMASEAGVLHIAPEKITIKGRLQPGHMFLVDFEQGRIVPDQELKHTASHAHPYAEWVGKGRVELKDLSAPQHLPQQDRDSLIARMRAFGWTTEHLHFLVKPMSLDGKEPLGSMGNDAPPAAMSEIPRLTYDYFQQLFAQVTNPPVDSIREEVIMTLQGYIGPQGNLLAHDPSAAHRLLLHNPILTDEELAKLKELNQFGWRSRVIDMTFRRSRGQDGLERALERICFEATAALKAGDAFLILSDRKVGQDRVAVSTLLAVGAVHHHLIRNQARTRIGIIVETGEAREVHHHCLLVGYGADAINPYLVYEAVEALYNEGRIDRQKYTPAKLNENYRKAVSAGMRKVMGKMGISTLSSYKAAQIFEAVGLDTDVIDRCFVGTASRIRGVNLAQLGQEALQRHAIGYPEGNSSYYRALPNPGEYHWRAEGEKHMWNPTTIASLQKAARTNSRAAYTEFARFVNEDEHGRCSLRGLLKFLPSTQPIALDEVEPASEIVKRFVTGAMSFGSISKEAHETLAVAMNRLGGKSNTGEGGEDYERFQPLPNGDSKRSAIKQVASGRFGVTAWYLTNADELQIKMAQGAKPGEGGELPGHKVSETIARTRHSTTGVGLISPPPHHDIYSIEDLKQLIFDLKNANPSARISVKLVSKVGVGTIAAGVAKAKAEHILISGHDGGTGASPLTGVKHAGLPWELGLAETHQTLVLNDLRSRVVLQTDGQLKTGRDVVIAALLGAEEFGFSTAPLITLGCIMMRKCHLNTCPVGVATQDETLRQKFTGQPEHVVNYLWMVAEEARQIMAQLGIRKFNDLIGRVDLLEVDEALKHWKSQGIDLSPVLLPAQKKNPATEVYHTQAQDFGLENVLDQKLIALSQPALQRREPVSIQLPIQNIDRTTGTLLSHEICRTFGEPALPDETIHIKFDGTAGQSFGAWLVRGVTLELEGDANDYVGKGLSGGRIVVYPPQNAPFAPENNIIIGNVALYGAIAGSAFFRGQAAERFAVRNSGVQAVIEGVGDHGCEYMTGGRVVVLGPTGRNFAAGMSGGVAYVWDPRSIFASRCNLGMVALEHVTESADIAELQGLIRAHFAYTGSTVAERILNRWQTHLPEFVKVMPTDYKRVLAERKQ
jgi:glutamate synthase (NADPH/NADH) large chain